jgi:hypothetical protein
MKCILDISLALSTKISKSYFSGYCILSCLLLNMQGMPGLGGGGAGAGALDFLRNNPQVCPL